MPSLMSIPEELRDYIIELVLLDQRIPPSNVESARRGRIRSERKEGDGFICWEHGPLNVFHEPSQTPNSSSLLLVCRYLREQTKQALRRLFLDGIKCKLDVMMVNDAQLFPTCIHVPAMAKKIHTVDVTVRIFGRASRPVDSLFMVLAYEPRRMVWPFFWLLESFLAYGVANPGTANAEAKNDLSIQNININVISGDEDYLIPEDTKAMKRKWRIRHAGVNPSHWPGEWDSDATMLAKGEPARMHPKWLADFVGDAIAGLIYMRNHDALYATLIHERIGAIKVHSQGELIKEIQPGEVLPGLKERLDEQGLSFVRTDFRGAFYDCNPLTFWNWKCRAVQERQRLGLPLLEPIIWPTLVGLKNWRRMKDEHRKKLKHNNYCGKHSKCRCNERCLEEMLEDGRLEGTELMGPWP